MRKKGIKLKLQFEYNILRFHPKIILTLKMNECLLSIFFLFLSKVSHSNDSQKSYTF